MKMCEHGRWFVAQPLPGAQALLRQVLRPSPQQRQRQRVQALAPASPRQALAHLTPLSAARFRPLPPPTSPPRPPPPPPPSPPSPPPPPPPPPPRSSPC